MQDNWVDFKAVKAAVTMEMVLGRYHQINWLRKKGDELHGRCPIHQGEEFRCARGARTRDWRPARRHYRGPLYHVAAPRHRQGDRRRGHRARGRAKTTVERG